MRLLVACSVIFIIGCGGSSYVNDTTGKVDANDLGGKVDGIDVVSDQDGVDAMDDDGPDDTGDGFIDGDDQGDVQGDVQGDDQGDVHKDATDASDELDIAPDEDTGTDTTDVLELPEEVQTDVVIDCELDTDCPHGQFCYQTWCRDWNCQPNELFCLGVQLVLCNERGSGANLVETCPAPWDPCYIDGRGCENGACLPATAVDCDDNNPCTTDRCDQELGCVNTPNMNPCDDGNICTIDDRCTDGKCQGGATLPCDDNNPCTADYCSSLHGCMHTPVEGSCDDLDPCTVWDQCREGKCAGTLANCDDEDPCTLDTCANGVCQNIPIPGCGTCAFDSSCDDGNDCTIDKCEDGSCSYYLAPGCCSSDSDCDDADPCTLEICDGAPFGKCVFSAADDCCEGQVINHSFADGLGDFQLSVLDEGVGWQLATAPDDTVALYYGNTVSGNYDNGLRNLGSAFSPLIVLPTKVDSTFTFRVWMDVEQVPGSDVLTVNAKTHAGSVKLWEKPGGFAMGAWQTISVDLSALGGKAIILEFHFDSVDEVANEGHGVFIKDLAITSDCMQRTCEITSDCVSLGYEGDCVAGLCNFESILQVKTVFGIGIFADALGVPSSIVLAPDGQRLFVSDKQRHRVAVYNRQAKLLYTFGASGTNVGQMNQPRGLVINNDQLFVADTGNHRIQVFSLSGVLMWTFGSVGTERSQFTQPKAVATSPDEELIYVADTGNHRIQVFNRYGVYRFAFGSYGKEVGQFRSPSCVAAGVNGDIYVCDTQNNRIQVFYPNGTFKSVIGAGELSQPYGLVLLPDDTLVVVSSYAHQVVWISSDNAVLSRFGVYGSKDGQFAYPLGIASYEDSLFVADANNARVVELVRGPLQ